MRQISAWREIGHALPLNKHFQKLVLVKKIKQKETQWDKNNSSSGSHILSIYTIQKTHSLSAYGNKMKRIYRLGAPFCIIALFYLSQWNCLALSNTSHLLISSEILHEIMMANHIQKIKVNSVKTITDHFIKHHTCLRISQARDLLCNPHLIMQCLIKWQNYRQITRFFIFMPKSIFIQVLESFQKDANSLVSYSPYDSCTVYQVVMSGAGPRAVGTERGRWS